jgi:hypothetical protein
MISALEGFSNWFEARSEESMGGELIGESNWMMESSSSVSDSLLPKGL